MIVLKTPRLILVIIALLGVVAIIAAQARSLPQLQESDFVRMQGNAKKLVSLKQDTSVILVLSDGTVATALPPFNASNRACKEKWRQSCKMTTPLHCTKLGRCTIEGTFDLYPVSRVLTHKDANSEPRIQSDVSTYADATHAFFLQ